jgi:hypothetical protein
MSEHGLVTPVSMIHSYVVNGVAITESHYIDEPFRLFRSNSTISFSAPK